MRNAPKAPQLPSAKHDDAWLLRASGLALAAAVSLGLARFSYALLLPPMRAELGWNYFTAGAMNTVNAAGYLIGALLMPRAMAHVDVRRLLLAGGGSAAVVLALHGLAPQVLAPLLRSVGLTPDTVLYALRLAAGVASAVSFVAGGVLAARLASSAIAGRAGFILGLYYGGTGLGILASAVLVPPWLARPALGWPAAWLALGGAALLATAVTAATTRSLSAAPAAAAARRAPVGLRPMAFGLAGYLMFGLGYIGYMTFIVTLLREQGMATGVISAFYALLGAGVVASSWLWAGLLQRQRGGRAMALLNGLLALATLLPVLSQQPLVVFTSGLLFGSVFLSVVASTTALVRHNLPAAHWPAGITAFTVIFAAGQIIGPSLVGWVADGPISPAGAGLAAGWSGLGRGLACSAAVLALGSALAWRQRPFGAAERSA